MVYKAKQGLINNPVFILGWTYSLIAVITSSSMLDSDIWTDVRVWVSKGLVTTGLLLISPTTLKINCFVNLFNGSSEIGTSKIGFSQSVWTVTVLEPAAVSEAVKVLDSSNAGSLSDGLTAIDKSSSLFTSIRDSASALVLHFPCK